MGDEKQGAAPSAQKFFQPFDGFDVDSNSTAWRLNIGWRFNDYLSLEGGYQNFGRFEQQVAVGGETVNLSLKADGFTLGAIGSLPLNERFALFVRAGAYFWDGDADINDVTEASPEETNIYLGLGARFAFNERLSATLDGSRYDLDGSDSSLISVGLDYRF